MHPAPSLDATAATDAVVVFVRAASACDGGAAFRVVDDAQRFVGESAPATKFAVHVAPGHHAFFAWQPGGDVPRFKYPEVNQVGALERDFEAGKTYWVDVAIANHPFEIRKSCSQYQWVALRMVAPGSEAALADAATVAPDAAEGQRVVDADHDETARHVGLGMQKLARRAEARH
jgi:hypothetical protein